LTSPRIVGRRTDLAVTGALLAALAATSLLNAFTYPPLGGFDAEEHIAYARALLESGGLPEAGASYTPPGFYVLAGAAIRVGEALGLEPPERGGLILNALITVATGFLVLVLARLLFPGRALLRWAALAFFISCPIVLKTGAMFHPQPLAMFLSTLAFVLCARMIVRRRYGVLDWIALLLTLGAAQLVRSVTIWSVVLVFLTLVVAAVAQPDHRRRIGTALALAAAAAVLIPLPWYLHLNATGSNPILGRGTQAFRFEGYWPRLFYVSPELPDVITKPHRRAMTPRFFPLLYTDTWGDYWGIWSWGPPRPELTPKVNRRLTVQSLAGLPLTAFAFAGWLAVAGLALARWREWPARLLIAGAAPLGIAAALYYVTRRPSPDGDTVKAMFLLPAVPFWALSFGFAADVLLLRSRLVGRPVLAILGACCVITLAFATFWIVT
jgi:hypothetical protein